jgi:transposase-like protein
VTRPSLVSGGGDLNSRLNRPVTRVTEVAQDLGLSPQTIYSWRRQAEIDAGERPRLSTAEAAELTAARRE